MTSLNGTRQALPSFARAGDLERRLLAILIADPSKAEDIDLRSERFVVPEHRTICGAFLDSLSEYRMLAAKDDGPVLPDLLYDRLSRAGEMNDSIAATLQRMAGDIDDGQHAPYLAAQVRDAAHRRIIADGAERLRCAAWNETAIIDLIDMADGLTAHVREAVDQQHEWYTAAKLAGTLFPLEYLIPGILVRGQPCILAGPQKSLKTSIAIDLALSLAYGTPLLKRFPVPRRVRVALVSGESGPGTIRETLLRVAAAHGADLASLESLIVSFDMPHLSNAADIARLERTIVRERIDVLILDPTYLMMDPGPEASNLFSMGRVLGALTRLCQQTGVTLIILHHTKRSGRSKDDYCLPELSDIAWAGFPEWARQWILLNRRESYDPGSGGLHKLWMNVGGSAGHSGAWALDIAEGTTETAGGRFWSPVVCSASEARAASDEARAEAREKAAELKQAKTVERRKREILDFLATCPEGETKTRLKTELRMNAEVAGTALRLLEESGKIERCKVKKQGTEYDGYRLPSTRPDNPDN